MCIKENETSHCSSMACIKGKKQTVDVDDLEKEPHSLLMKFSIDNLYERVWRLIISIIS